MGLLSLELISKCFNLDNWLISTDRVVENTMICSTSVFLNSDRKGTDYTNGRTHGIYELA